MTDEDDRIVQNFLTHVEAEAEHKEDLGMYLNHFRRLQEDEDYRDRFRRLGGENVVRVMDAFLELARRVPLPADFPPAQFRGRRSRLV